MTIRSFQWPSCLQLLFCANMACAFLMPNIDPAGYESDRRQKRDAEDPKFVPLECQPFVDDFSSEIGKYDFNNLPPRPKEPTPTTENQKFSPFNRLKVIQILKAPAARLNFFGQQLLKASKFLVRRYNFTKHQASVCLPHFDFSSIATPEGIQECVRTVNPLQICAQGYKYRTIDGSCNNILYPNWGKSFSCFDRLIKPDYADGFNSLRANTAGKSLPNPRFISSNLNTDVNIPNLRLNLVTMQFGQFIDHDLTLTPMKTKGENQTKITCCNATNPDRDCIPIHIPPNDPFFSQFNTNCLDMVRSALCPFRCRLGPRQHIDQLTAYVDGSQIYGSTQDETDYLRSFQDGLLKSTFVNGSEFLPPSRNPVVDECSIPEKICFEAGDTRVNEQPGLTVMHTVWMRQHNRIAAALKTIFPAPTSDEELFQETRRIVVAQLQHVVYGEWLPIVLGPKYTEYFDIRPLQTGNTGYNNRIQAAIFNEFSAAAFRVGHSLIQNDFDLLDENYLQTGTVELKSHFFFPLGIYENFDQFLRGLCTEPQQTTDRHIVQAVTNHLYQVPDALFGMDLIALNLNRGRDRGIPSYTKYVRFCFGNQIPINRFSDLNPLMSQDAWSVLEKLYDSVEDVDLFSGAISERRVANGGIGPTFACIIGTQFNRLKFGDRHFYEHGNQDGSFSSAQLDAIRGTTSLAQIICKNSNVGTLQPNVFVPADASNSRIDCSQYSDLDLSLWKPQS